MNKTKESILEEFDKKFGKLKDGCTPGDDVSDGEGAGCDDCCTNQEWRLEIKDFLYHALDQYADWKIKECLPEKEVDLTLEPFNVTAEYRLGELRGRNQMIDIILSNKDKK